MLLGQQLINCCYFFGVNRTKSYDFKQFKLQYIARHIENIKAPKE